MSDNSEHDDFDFENSQNCDWDIKKNYMDTVLKNLLDLIFIEARTELALAKEAQILGHTIDFDTYERVFFEIDEMKQYYKNDWNVFLENTQNDSE